MAPGTAAQVGTEALVRGWGSGRGDRATRACWLPSRALSGMAHAMIEVRVSLRLDDRSALATATAAEIAGFVLGGQRPDRCPGRAPRHRYTEHDCLSRALSDF